MQVSFFFFLFRLFSYKILAEFNMLGKASKDGKTKIVLGKKRICDAVVVSFNFLLPVY